MSRVLDKGSLWSIQLTFAVVAPLLYTWAGTRTISAQHSQLTMPSVELLSYDKVLGRERESPISLLFLNKIEFLHHGTGGSRDENTGGLPLLERNHNSRLRAMVKQNPIFLAWHAYSRTSLTVSWEGEGNTSWLRCYWHFLFLPSLVDFLK